MLVLSRKKDECIYIGENIRVVVVDIRGDKVQLGVEAPKDVSVFRAEVLEKINREREPHGNSADATLDLSRAETRFKSEPRGDDEVKRARVEIPRR